MVLTGNLGTASGTTTQTAILTVPKLDLLAATKTNDADVKNNYTLLSDQPLANGDSNQAVQNYDSNGNTLLLTTLNNVDSNTLGLISISNAQTDFPTVANPVSITLPATITAPIAAPQPNGGPSIPASSGTFGLGIDARLSNVVEINGDLWVARTVLDTTTNTDAIAWYEISLTTDKVTQSGVISSPSLFFYYPSIAVNSTGDVVIGFNGSSTSQFISSYVSIGTTSAGVTTFSPPTLVQSGQGVFDGNSLTVPTGAPTPLWGDQSVTVIDPSNPDGFWTFQQISDEPNSKSFNNWAIQATDIVVQSPSVTLTVTGPTPPSTPPKLGVLGDSLSAGDVTGTTPGWVSDVTTNGPFVLPPGGNQAADGATVANLASEISALPAGLNYTTVIIGGNDAVNLVEGNETAATYLSTVVNDVENALATLETDGDHPVVATVPDIFDTPLIVQEVANLNISTAQVTAFKSVIQEANSEIAEFALAHGIPVIDLYAATDALLTTPLTIGGVNFSVPQLFSSDGFHPSPIIQGLLGNMVIDAVDLAYGTGLAPITDQQLLTDVGDTATVTGPTYFNLAPIF